MMEFLVVAMFLHMITLTLAKQCSYTSFTEIIYYTCSSNQYCCGRKSCCYSDYYHDVYDLWYFWFCLCFGIFICSLASGAYYRKRQLREVQIAAAVPNGNRMGGHIGDVPLMHGQGAPNGGLGMNGLMHPAQQRNLMVTTTASSGQPFYPPHGYYHDDAQHPGYQMYPTVGGSMYPAYAFMPPPPSYSSLADAGHSVASRAPASTACRSASREANERSALSPPVTS